MILGLRLRLALAMQTRAICVSVATDWRAMSSAAAAATTLMELRSHITNQNCNYKFKVNLLVANCLILMADPRVHSVLICICICSGSVCVLFWQFAKVNF